MEATSPQLVIQLEQGLYNPNHCRLTTANNVLRDNTNNSSNNKMATYSSPNQVASIKIIISNSHILSKLSNRYRIFPVSQGITEILRMLLQLKVVIQKIRTKIASFSEDVIQMKGISIPNLVQKYNKMSQATKYIIIYDMTFIYIIHKVLIIKKYFHNK